MKKDALVCGYMIHDLNIMWRKDDQLRWSTLYYLIIIIGYYERLSLTFSPLLSVHLNRIHGNFVVVDENKYDSFNAWFEWIMYVWGEGAGDTILQGDNKWITVMVSTEMWWIM